MAWGDEQEQDFGFGTRTGQGGFTGGAQMHDMAADPTFAGDFGASQMGSASSADIADLLEAAADAEVRPSFSSPIGPEGALQGSTAPTTNIQRVQSLREDQQRVNEQIEREIAAIEELNRVNRLSVGASNVTQPWDNPYAGANPYAGLGEYRAPAPTTGSYWEGGFNPQLDSHPADWENVTQGMNPQGIPRYSSPTSPEGALTPTSPEFSSPFSPEGALTAGWTGTSPVGEVEDAIGPPGQLGPTAVQLDMGSGYQPSPFTSPLSPEGAISGPISPYDASQSLNEYEMPSRQQQRRAASVAASPFDAGVMPGAPMAPAFSSPFSPEGALTAGQTFDDYQPEEWEGPDTLEVERAAAGIVAEGEGILQGPITKEELERITTPSDLDKYVKPDVLEKSKKLTKDEKKANVAARRKAEEDYVAFRDELNFRVEVAKSGLAKEIKDHGKKSKEAKKARSILRGRKDDARMWERSDIYNKSYGMVNRPWLSNIGPMKLLTGIENIFHSWGKTERRSPQDLLDDMKANPEKYERVGAEISAAQLVRNMYSFLRKAPMDVAAAAAREPAYLRYLINLNVNKQPIPTSYSSNWKNDISDAWIYG